MWRPKLKDDLLVLNMMDTRFAVLSSLARFDLERLTEDRTCRDRNHTRCLPLREIKVNIKLCILHNGLIIIINIHDRKNYESEGIPSRD